MSSSPLVAAADEDAASSCCLACGQTAPVLTVACECCETPLYCSQACRTADAAEHREDLVWLRAPGDNPGRIGKACYNGCGKAGTQLCQDCHVAIYCSAACQAEDWQHHHQAEHLDDELMLADAPLAFETWDDANLALVGRRRGRQGRHHRRRSGDKWIQKAKFKKGAERAYLRRTHQNEARALANPRTSTLNRRRIYAARTLRRLARHRRGKK